jgi:MoxR-like ATPase
MAWLGTRLWEREVEVHIGVLAVMSGQNALYLSPPGAAKSALVNLLFSLFPDARIFSTLLHQGMPESELIGPPSIAALQQGRLERVTDRRLADCDLAFLDETGRASPVTLNAVLGALNAGERTVNLDGSMRVLPLRSVFGATNTWLSAESLQAMVDRYLFRAVSSYLQEPDNRKACYVAAPRRATKAPAAPPVAVSLAELDVVTDAVYAMPIPADVADAVLAIQDGLARAGLAVSDRRMQASMLAPRAAALLEGRTVTTVEDLAVLQHTLWQQPEERAKVAAIVLDVACPALRRALELVDAVAEQRRTVLARAGAERTAAHEAIRKAGGEFAALLGFRPANPDTYGCAEFSRHLGAASGQPPKVLEAGKRLAQLWGEAARAVAGLSGTGVR